MWLIELSTDGFKLNRKGWSQILGSVAGSFGQRCDTSRALGRVRCSRTGATATCSPSPIMPSAICWGTTPRNRTPKSLPLRPLSTLSESWAAAGHPFLRRRPARFPMVCSTSPRVSVLWLRLGISLERIKPGHSQQNSRHETQAAAARWRQYPTRAGRVRRFHRKVQPFLVLSFVRPVEASLVA